MYTTCLHCHGDLGRNESIELFPVGRRLAFDQAKGRLWVICTHCARWNLTPMEDRWEVIEACERLYRERPERMTSGEIGVAKASDGLLLVRIGRPVFPEYAAWRYGQRFENRRRRHLIITGGLLTAGLAMAVGSPVLIAGLLGAGSWGGLFLYYLSAGLYAYREVDRPLGTLQPVGGGMRLIRSGHAFSARLITHVAGDFRIDVPPHRNPAGGSGDDIACRFEGDSARQFLRLTLPCINREGASGRMVGEAIRELGLATGTPDPLATAHRQLVRKGFGYSVLREYPRMLRVGLEMAAMEGQERRWLESELYLLKAAWEEADVLAKLADGLATPAWLDERLAALKERAGVDRSDV